MAQEQGIRALTAETRDVFGSGRDQQQLNGSGLPPSSVGGNPEGPAGRAAPGTPLGQPTVPHDDEPVRPSGMRREQQPQLLLPQAARKNNQAGEPRADGQEQQDQQRARLLAAPSLELVFEGNEPSANDELTDDSFLQLLHRATAPSTTHVSLQHTRRIKQPAPAAGIGAAIPATARFIHGAVAAARRRDLLPRPGQAAEPAKSVHGNGQHVARASHLELKPADCHTPPSLARLPGASEAEAPLPSKQGPTSTSQASGGAASPGAAAVSIALPHVHASKLRPLVAQARQCMGAALVEPPWLLLKAPFRPGGW
jgi:hypothetical protein